ncbi:cellulose synthase/poly-beta-1,6-N-acetylglucosamine synthase-like glycosyltransferase [Roseimicrobium gellanilyticum]|uniref:Cellulose synthase/poly-beta-1,6-N-acetylglucosamine synthase-like glycosyltransferase n=2 Tax=Roseimicrobium gellanilyticum TaxID=748857 RepID=A0A366HW06_9BACT|nr:cellulose synthase/poly-beta-1,6-N-acetylglucosamine synthase-like glycosyltransferase [Roseimicrobium gellanilyticum]
MLVIVEREPSWGWSDLASWEWIALGGLVAALVLLFYTYAGFPLLMGFLSRLTSNSKNRKQESGSPMNRISVILCVHNEEARLASRLENLLSLDWPMEGEVVVVCDGCTDNSAEVARQVGQERVRVVELSQKSGKPSGINAGVEQASGDVLIFCDARQEFESSALRHLVAELREENTGAVSGLLRIAKSSDGSSGGFDRYWSLETKLRKWESDWDSAIGCTGAIYALRRECFVELPPDTILDDVVIPMQAVMQGRRVGYSVEAIAWDPQPLAPQAEHRRKLRTLAGNFQMLFRHPGWLNPFQNRTWWQLISHKYLRIASPFVLAAALLCTVVLARHPLFLLLLVGELAFIGLGWLAMECPALARRIPGARILGAFLSMQVTIVRGLATYMRYKKNMLDIWKSGHTGVSGAKE